MPITSEYLQASDGNGDAALLTVTADRLPGSTTLKVSGITNWPNKFMASVGTVDSSGLINPASVTNFYGHVNGSDLEIEGYIPGSSDGGNSIGQKVMIKPTTEWANFISTSIKNIMQPDGSALGDNVVDTPQIKDRAITADKINEILLSGWIPLGATLTFGTSDTAAGGATSANGVSTYTATLPGDYTTVLSVGMKLRLVQTTTKYFFITKVAFSGGTTTLTMYGGTDYSLVNATISDPFYSVHKAPLGFPLDVIKWSVTMNNNVTQSQSSPVVGTWYNLGSLQITAPIGSWVVSMSGTMFGGRATGTAEVYATLSAANNTEDNVYWTYQGYSTAGGGFGNPFYKERPLVVSNKLTLYLNLRTNVASMSSVALQGVVAGTTLTVKCAYL